jgi:tRNA(Ser,Leu) C12 N-acetylase TAN1
MEGHERDARRALRPLARLRSSPFRNVLLARVEDPAAVLGAIDDLAARRPELQAWVGKVLPIVRTFAIDPERFGAQAEDAIAPFLDVVAGRSYHVRVERRGHKGRIDSHAAERALGEWIFEALEARGSPARVDFDDADVVVAVEVVGNAAGVALLPRALREAHRFVRID